MALEPIISKGGNAGGARMPGVDASAYGGGIGRGLMDVADAIQRRKDAHSQAEAAKAFAEFRLADDEARRARRDSADPWAGGHEESVAADYDERQRSFLDSIKDGKLRQQYEARTAEYRTSIISAEREWGDKTRDERFVTDSRDMADIQINRIRTGTAQEWDQEKTLWHDYVSALPLADTVKDALRKEVDAKMDVAFIRNVNEKDPELARRMIGEGHFDASLSPQQLEAMLNDSDVEIGRRKNEAAAAQRQEATEARGKINLMMTQVRDGMAFSEEDFAQAKAMAAKYGMDDKLYDIGKAQIGNRYNRIAATWTPEQWDAERSRLRAKVGADPAKANPDDVLALATVEQMATQHINAARQDPLGWGERLTALPPVDMGNAASINDRKIKARAIGQQLGMARVPYLKPDEVNQMQAALKGGVQQRDAAIAGMAAWGDAAAALADQVAPGDATTKHLLFMRGNVRRLALEGQDVMKANPTIASVDKANAAFLKFVPRGAHGPLIPRAALEGTMGTARAVAAAAAARDNKAAPNDGDWSIAIHVALGGEGMPGTANARGGVGRWKGHALLLPVGMTQAQFDSAFTGLGTPKKWPGRKPVWGGKDVDLGTIRSQFIPVAERDGVYRFVTPTGAVLMADDGAPFLLNMWKALRR